MFTGIVEELGTVEAVEPQGDALRLSIRAATVLDDLRLDPTDITLLGRDVRITACLKENG